MIATLATHPTADLVAEALHPQWAQAQEEAELADAMWQAWLDVPAAARRKHSAMTLGLLVDRDRKAILAWLAQRRAWAWVVRVEVVA